MKASKRKGKARYSLVMRRIDLGKHWTRHFSGRPAAAATGWRGIPRGAVPRHTWRRPDGAHSDSGRPDAVTPYCSLFSLFPSPLVGQIRGGTGATTYCGKALLYRDGLKAYGGGLKG